MLNVEIVRCGLVIDSVCGVGWIPRWLSPSKVRVKLGRNGSGLSEFFKAKKLFHYFCNGQSSSSFLAPTKIFILIDTSN